MKQVSVEKFYHKTLNVLNRNLTVMLIQNSYQTWSMEPVLRPARQFPPHPLCFEEVLLSRWALPIDCRLGPSLCPKESLMDHRSPFQNICSTNIICLATKLHLHKVSSLMVIEWGNYDVTLYEEWLVSIKLVPSTKKPIGFFHSFCDYSKNKMCSIIVHETYGFVHQDNLHKII